MQYIIEIDDSVLQKINVVEKEGNIIVKMTKEESDATLGFNLVALEILNNNKVQYLREDRPLEEKLVAGEIKLYKYINSDQNVKEIRIHVNEVSGIVKLSGVIKN